MSNVPKNVMGEGLRTSAPLTVHALAQAKKLQPSLLRQLGLSDLPHGGVSIPYYDEMHAPIAVKRRTALAASDGSYWAAGVPLSAYGRWRLDEARSQRILLLVEGESDCWTLWYHNMPALGIPGSHCFKTLEADMLAGIDKLFLHIEPDIGGKAFESNGLRRLAELRFPGQVYLFRMPDGVKDPSALHMEAPERFLDRLGLAMTAARPATPTHLTPIPANRMAAPVPASETKADDEQAILAIEEVNLSDVASEPVQWLWQARIPLGKLTILDGDPGLGKSSIGLDLAARLTRGSPMPGDQVGDLQDSLSGTVVLLTAEDGLGDTIRPRLEAAGAVLERIVALKSMIVTDKRRRPLAIPIDVPAIAKIVKDTNAKLVLIDPLMAYLDDTVSAHNDQSIRRALLPLSEMAEDTGAAVVVVRHLNKQPGKNAVYRGGGSIGIIGAARGGLMVVKDRDNPHQRWLGVSKCNLCQKPPTVRFEVVSSERGPKILWLDQSDNDIEDHLEGNEGEADSTNANQAVEFLKERLKDHIPVPALVMYAEGAELGISNSTLSRSRDKAGVRSRRVKTGDKVYWEWWIPS